VPVGAETRRLGGATRRRLSRHKSQESTDRAIAPWPGRRSSKGTDSRGEQSFEAGVPAAVSGEPGRFEKWALQNEPGNG